MEKQHITIIGGGIAGLTTAIALKRIGHTVSVFEAAPHLRPVGAGISLGPNAINAFAALDLKQALLGRGRLVRTLHILDHRGGILTRTQVPSDLGPGVLCIHRADLHAFLLEQLDPKELHTDRRVASLVQDHEGVTVRFTDGGEHHAALLIAADGIRSAVRRCVLPRVQPRYAGYAAWRGVVHLPGMGDIASETWGPRGRFGIVPLADDHVYWFATSNALENDARFAAFRIADLQRHFAGYHTTVRQVLAHASDEHLIQGGIHDLPPLEHFAHGRVLLIGDAAHATTPNMGQGACQAIEDAVLLAHYLHNTPDATTAFRAFEQDRMPRTSWVVRNSRTIGGVGQWQHPLAIALRNALIRRVPPRIGQRRFDLANNVRFPHIPAVSEPGLEKTTSTRTRMAVHH